MMIKRFFTKKNHCKTDLENLPVHIGIIMDGNGRWAKKRQLPRSAGHAAGAKTFEKVVEYAGNIGIKIVTVYAFSTENWGRPKEEVDALMALLEDYQVGVVLTCRIQILLHCFFVNILRRKITGSYFLCNAFY